MIPSSLMIQLRHRGFRQILDNKLSNSTAELKDPVMFMIIGGIAGIPGGIPGGIAAIVNFLLIYKHDKWDRKVYLDLCMMIHKVG